MKTTKKNKIDFFLENKKNIFFRDKDIDDELTKSSLSS